LGGLLRFALGTRAGRERWTCGPGVDESLVGQRQPKIYYYEADGIGSVTSLTDPTGAIAATYTYDSFGNTTASTGSATNSFRYAGREFDSSTALYYNRARYYDQTTGRFLSEDPVGFFGGSSNLYPYVENNPVRLKDAAGLSPQDSSCKTHSRFTLGVRQPGQSLQACLSQNRSNYSIAGLFNIQNSVGQFVLGNDLASLFFGDFSEGATSLGISESATKLFTASIGIPSTVGRRTASIISLNIKGITGPAPTVLGKTGAEKIADWLVGLGELKLAGDAGFTAAEVIGCLINQ
jgi:RHS repeat-associated protein